MYRITCLAQSGSIVERLGDDHLLPCELVRRDELIAEGIKECRSELGKQTSRDMYFFYEGALEGFKVCRGFNKFSDYRAAMVEEGLDMEREMAKSIRPGVDPILDEIREKLHIYWNERTDDDRVWYLDGKRTQIEYVYSRLKTIRRLISGGLVFD